MAKFCIFCGNPPQDKNAEHVIPQWLINMTGKRSRQMCLDSITDRPISFGNFTFPACEKCNSEFAELEAAVKPVVEKILAGKSVNAIELHNLMDWFDKVRVGLWLGFLQLKGEVDDKKPHMHIKTRVGRKDRMLIVERVDDAQPGIGIIGANTEAFLESPNAFQFRINNYIFTNVSDLGLVSRRLGFPFTDRYVMQNLNGKVTVNNMQAAKGRVVTPVISNFVSPANSFTIYQPMFPAESQLFPKLYDAEYVKKHSLKPESGIGGIFIQRGSGPATYLADDQSVALVPKFSTENAYQCAVKLFQLHNHVLTTTYTTRFATPFERRVMDGLNQERIRANNKRIEMYRQMKDVVEFGSNRQKVK